MREVIRYDLKYSFIVAIIGNCSDTISLQNSRASLSPPVQKARNIMVRTKLLVSSAIGELL